MDKNNAKQNNSWIRRYWWLGPCFLVFFVIGGVVGWAWFLAQSDIGSQGLHGDEDTKEMQAFRQEEPRRFLHFGLMTGVAGNAIVIGTRALANRLRKRHG
jgi:hypothetical protein